ncbi:uncharacterized protein [Cardiocondyla obscurior]
MQRNTDVVIVGAGASGIAAASRLLKRGVEDFIVLEANDRIGGRIYTKAFGENVVDLGAQWVHGETGNIVFNLASKHDLLSSGESLLDPSKHEFVTINGEIMPLEESSAALTLYFNNLDKMKQKGIEKETGNYGDFFIREYYKDFDENPFMNRSRVAEYLSWLEKMENSIQSSDTWFDVSIKGLIEYWDCEGNLLLNWKDRGYKTILDVLMQKIPNPEERLPVMEKIKFRKVVTTINYNSSENVIVTTRDGCEYSAPHVIFTGSLGVLKDKHSTMFVPPLSQKKQRAIEGLNIGSVDKVFLEFPHRWWPENKSTFNFMWPEQIKQEFLETYGQNNEWLCDVFSFFTVAYQPNLLCAWIVGRNARHMETLSDSDVADGLYLLLEKALKEHYDIVKPTRILRSKWFTDEHFQGSYSFQSMVSEQINAKPKDLAEPIMNGSKPVILFAGEATHDHYYSTVHGAVETGFREADRLINYKRPCDHLDQLIGNFDEALRIKVDASAKKMERTRIVIVGAGIAGLAAAKTLEDAGFKDYILFEAQDVVGGRIYSQPWNNGWIDYGAQFLHGDKSKLAQYCLNNDLLSDIQGTDGEGIFLRDDGMIMNKNLVHEVDDLVRTILDDICESQTLLKEENIGSVMKSRFESYLRERNDSPQEKQIKQEIFDWNVRFLLVDNSCHSLNDLSALLWGKFKYVGGPEYLLFKSGYSSLTDLLVNKLDRRKIRLATPVEIIYWRNSIDSLNDSPITVKTYEGTQIFADAVIVTCSLGYLKENYRQMFQPQLPNRLSVAIEDLGFGTISKIFLDFGVPWWKKGESGFQLLWRKDADCQSLPEWTKDLTGFDVWPLHPATLVGWVGGRGACIIEDLSEETIAQVCINLLTRFLPSRNIPPVRKCIRTKWNGNRYTRGGYSHITKICEKDDVSPRTLAEPVWTTMLHKNTKRKKNLPIILFAGEATHDEFYSTTHGAYETGIHQAQVFLQYHEDVKCVDIWLS